MHNSMDTLSSCQVYLSSQSGAKCESLPNCLFEGFESKGADQFIEVFPEQRRQKLIGIGGSFTESSAWVLAHLEVEQRASLMKAFFSEEGANYSLARTTIGSTDFCVKGKYSYVTDEQDVKLDSFSIDVDKDGFSPDEFPDVKDSEYDLLPMIKEALDIKKSQSSCEFKIIASAWTAPPWMKSNKEWFGGELANEFMQCYADYLGKYIDAYGQEGVEIWGLTPVNEPLGNDSNWESMHFTPQSQRDFIKSSLGPAMKHRSVKLLMFDHARPVLEDWADTLYSDEDCARYLYGSAVHWYDSTFKVFEEVFERVHEKYPEFAILHTEGCVDNLGNDAPEGVLDPAGYKESGWFNNDSFWWTESATDWAYSATWPGLISEDHPKYAPVHRYARDLIVGLNHWLEGWVDWNLVLDQRGGPNHVHNYCGAPVMVDLESGFIYYTPIHYVMTQFSRTIRPGDTVVYSKVSEGLQSKGVVSCSTMNDNNLLTVQIHNPGQEQVDCELIVHKRQSKLVLPANSIKTIQVELDKSNVS